MKSQKSFHPAHIHSFMVTNTVLVTIFMLTLITAGAHLYLSTQPEEKLRFWFLLNGAGYLTLLTAFFLPQFSAFRRIIRKIFLGYVLLTITLWFFLGSPREGTLDPFDIMVKAVELTLAVHLFLESRKNSAQS